MVQMQPPSSIQTFLAQVGQDTYYLFLAVRVIFFPHVIFYPFKGGIAWDWINEKLYWTDSCKDVIEVYDINTGYRKILVYTGSNSNNKDIVVDPTTG